MITPIQQEKLSDVVISKIKAYILDNDLQPGAPLPTEGELCELLGVSRNTVREAVKALSFLGIIDSAPRRGLTLGSVDMRRATEFLGFHLAISNYPKSQLLDARIAVEIGALPQAIGRLADEPELYERLVAINNELQAVRDVEQFVKNDLAFHRGLLNASNSELLIAFGDLIQVFFKRFRQDVMDAKANWAKGYEQHVAILTALKAGDLEKAQSILRDHLAYHNGHL